MPLSFTFKNSNSEKISHRIVTTFYRSKRINHLESPKQDSFQHWQFATNMNKESNCDPDWEKIRVFEWIIEIVIERNYYQKW